MQLLENFLFSFINWQNITLLSIFRGILWHLASLPGELNKQHSKKVSNFNEKICKVVL